jgi:hypothetical protein
MLLAACALLLNFSFRFVIAMVPRIFNCQTVICAALVVGFATAGTCVAQQSYAKFPAAGVEIPQPPGFEVAADFEGLLNKDLEGASVVVAHLPGPFAEISGGMTAEALQTQGMTLLSKEKTKVGEKPAVLLHATQSVEGIEAGKWLLVFGD